MPSRDAQWIVGAIAAAIIAIISNSWSTNARIDDLNANVNARIDDVNTSVNARIDDLRGEMNRRFDDLQADIRELRTLVIDALKRTEPAND